MLRKDVRRVYGLACRTGAGGHGRVSGWYCVGAIVLGDDSSEPAFFGGAEAEVLCLPYVGPVTWLLRARLERIDRERAEHERTARERGSAAASGGVTDSAPDNASEALSDTPTKAK